MSAKFAWVDFAGVLDNNMLSIEHVGFYAPGERISQFGEKSGQHSAHHNSQKLNPKVNAVYTAFITPFGVVFRQREMASPGRWVGPMTLWGPGAGPQLTGPKLQALINACDGRWSPTEGDQLRRCSAAWAKEVATAIKTTKVGYVAANPKARLTTLTTLVVMASTASVELPCADTWLKLPSTPVKKPVTVDPLEEALSMLAAAVSEEDEEGVSVKQQVELTRMSVEADTPPPQAVVTPKKKKGIQNPFEESLV